jgi:hypothetical protein
MRDNIFDNHAAFNHYQSILGMRPSENTTKPSVYISALKLRKAFKTLTDAEIKLIFNNDKLEILGLKTHREKLEEKLSDLIDWQYFLGLYILLRDGNVEAANYILNCRYTDVFPYEDEYILYAMIAKF